MHLSTLSPLVSFTLCALLSMSSVVGRPVKGGLATYVPAGRRSLSDVDLMADFLSRRAKSRSSSVSSVSSASSTRSLTSRRICVPGPKVAKRSYFEHDVYSRTTSSGGSSDMADITLDSLDPERKHMIAQPLVMTTDKLGEGSYGSVHLDPQDPKYLIKHIKDKEEAFTGWISKEIKYLTKAKQIKDYKYTQAADKRYMNEAWIWIKKHEGKTIEQLGLFMVSAGKTETTEFAKAHARKTPAREAFINDLIKHVVARALHYATQLGVQHMDMNGNNILIRMNGAKIESVELIDWGVAKTVTCTPQTEKDLLEEVTQDLKGYL